MSYIFVIKNFKNTYLSLDKKQKKILVCGFISIILYLEFLTYFTRTYTHIYTHVCVYMYKNIYFSVINIRSHLELGRSLR